MIAFMASGADGGSTIVKPRKRNRGRNSFGCTFRVSLRILDASCGFMPSAAASAATSPRRPDIRARIHAPLIVSSSMVLYVAVFAP